MNRLIIFCGLSLILFSCCSSEAETPTTESVSIKISLSDEIEQHQLNDELSMLGSINVIEFIDDDKMIITDNSPAIYLFEDYVMTDSFGKKGKGPCEFEAISAIELENEKLHVLDQSQTKIISYDVNTHECIGEIHNKNLSGARFLHKEIDSLSFIVGKTSYSSNTPDSTILAYRISEDESSKEIDFRLSQINSVNARISINPSGLDFRNLENKLYTYFPLTDSLYSFTLPDFTMKAYPLKIDIKRGEFEKAGNDAQKLIRILRDDFESVNNIFVHKNWLAVQVSQNSNEIETPNRFIQFYTHNGYFITQLSLNSKILTLHKNNFIELIENTDPNAEFAYSISYRPVLMRN